ncbi:PREDICTED: uncharacterized protein LOC104771252 [Camelina sativa]|uniref:Uncharacterized protein LOC104771252 n=1 Tax=Camelina sativa TaxID=90675 RepID=A0ABM0Y1I4_CAMSA|nr:PREDICTED: uncharacterized protein LOC104771252 [Camelina sativa]
MSTESKHALTRSVSVHGSIEIHADSIISSLPDSSLISLSIESSTKLLPPLPVMNPFKIVSSTPTNQRAMQTPFRGYLQDMLALVERESKEREALGALPLYQRTLP